jgi:hypothetical protein
MRHFLNALDYPGKDPDVVYSSDPLVIGSDSELYKKSESEPLTTIKQSGD